MRYASSPSRYIAAAISLKLKTRDLTEDNPQTGRFGHICTRLTTVRSQCSIPDRSSRSGSISLVQPSYSSTIFAVNIALSNLRLHHRASEIWLSVCRRFENNCNQNPGAFRSLSKGFLATGRVLLQKQVEEIATIHMSTWTRSRLPRTSNRDDTAVRNISICEREILSSQQFCGSDAVRQGRGIARREDFIWSQERLDEFWECCFASCVPNEQAPASPSAFVLRSVHRRLARAPPRLVFPFSFLHAPFPLLYVPALLCTPGDSLGASTALRARQWSLRASQEPLPPRVAILFRSPVLRAATLRRGH